EAPGVVVARTDKFQRRAIGLEAKDSLPESDFLPANRAAKSGIPDGAPNPVIETIAQVAGRRMRVPHAPAGEEHLTLVCLVVAVRILEKLCFAGMNDNDAAVGEDKTGRDAQLIGENREFVRASVTVGVLADFQAIVPLASGL